MRSRYSEICALIGRYGADATLGQIRDSIIGNNHICQNCNGRGYVTIEYNAYPTNLPDSGSVYKPGYEDVLCELCNGNGFTEDEYKPHMVQDGWDKVVK